MNFRNKKVVLNFRNRFRREIFTMSRETSRHEAKVCLIADIEAQIKDIQDRRKAEQAQEEREKGIGLLESGYFDSELYDGNGTQKGKYEGYVTSIAPNEDEDEEEDEPLRPADKRTTGFGAPVAFINDIARVSANCCNNLREKIDFIPFVFIFRVNPIMTRSRVDDQRQ